MLPATACPSQESLNQFLLGLASESDSEQVALHLLECSHCAALANNLAPSDDVVEILSRAIRIQEGLAPHVEAGREIAERFQATVSLSIDPTTAPPETLAVGSDVQAGVDNPAGSDGLVTSHESPLAPPAATDDVDPELYDFLSPPQAADELGRLGGYRVLRVLGAGGMGVVFEAEDLQLKRRVALKAMKPAIAASATARKRFLREAQTAASVEHDHIVTIHQVGDQRGVPFIAMPLLRGETLADRLNRELPCAELLRITREIASGLAAAHRAGLIHRDVKPANIWLEGDSGRVKILDFGLARATSADQQLTQAGALMGTPSYMSPEQARGDSVDARADLFSLGCVAYHMATGRRPFEGRDTLNTLLALSSERPRAPREINAKLPKAIERLILRLLEKDPASRYQAAEEVIDRVREIEQPSAPTTPSHEIMAGEPDRLSMPAARLAAGDAHATKPPRSRVLLAFAAAAAAVALLAGVVIIIKNRQGKVVAKIETKDKATVTPGEALADEGLTVEVVPSNEPSDAAPEVDSAAGRADDAGVEGPPTSADRQRPDPTAPRSEKIEKSESKIEKQVTLPPLSPMALVTEPAGIEGVKSWTVETIHHRGPIYQATFSPDGKLLATLGADATVRIWDPTSGKLLRAVAVVGPTSNLNVAPHGVVAWSPDGASLAVVDRSAIRICEIATGKFSRHAPLDGVRQVCAAAWSPDGKMLAVGVKREEVNELHDIEVYDIAEGEVLDTWHVELRVPGPYGRAIAWSPGSDVVAYGGWTWDLNTYEKHLVAIPGYVGETWRADGTLLLAIGEGLTSSAIHLARGDTKMPLFTLKGDGEPIVFRAFSPDGGMLLASADPANKLRAYIWDTATGERIKKVDFDLSGDRQPPGAYAVAPGGTAFAVSERPENGLGFVVYDVRNDRPMRLDSIASNDFSLSPVFPHRVAAWTSDRIVLSGRETRVWDLAAWRPGALCAESVFLSSVAWDLDGRRIRARGPHATNLYNALSGQFLFNSQHFPTPLCMSLSADNAMLAAAYERQVKVYDAETNKLPRSFDVETKLRPAFSPDAKRLATVADKTTVWDIETGRQLATLDAAGEPAFSPDGQRLASTVGGGERFEVWDIEANKIALVLENDDRIKAPGAQLVWSPDGGRIAGFGRVWEVASGKLALRLARVNASTTAAPAWSPDGRWLAYLAPDGATTIADAATGRVETTLLPCTRNRALAVDARGHFRASPRVDEELVYVVETVNGQETLSPAEFEDRYGWKNDPAQVGLGKETGTRERETDDGLASGGRKPPVDTRRQRSKPSSAIGDEPAPLSSLALVSRPPALRAGETFSIESVAPTGIVSNACIALQPGGQLLAIGGRDGHLRLFDWAAGKAPKLVKLLVGHDAPVFAVAWSRDGELIASVDSDQGNVRIWRTRSGRLVSSAFVDLNFIHSLSWSPGADAVVVCGEGGVRLIEPNSGELLPGIAQAGGVSTLTWSPDGKWLAGGCSPHSWIRDVATGAVRYTLSTPAPTRNYVFWSPDGKSLISFAHLGESISVWNSDDGTIGRTFPIPKLSDTADLLPYWLDDATIVIRCGEEFQAWSIDTGTRVKTSERHLGAWRSADGNVVASISGDGIEIEDESSGKHRTIAQAPYANFAEFSPDGRRLAFRCGDADTGIWDESAPREVVWLPTRGSCMQIRWFGDDGSLLAIGAGGGSRVFSAERNRWVERWLEGVPQLTSAGVSADGSLAICPAPDLSKLEIWELSPAKRIGEIEPNLGPIALATLSPDGAQVAFRAEQALAGAIWDVKAGKLLHRHPSELGTVWYWTWSADGSRIASFANVVTLHDSAGQVLNELSHDHDSCKLLAWSSDCKTLWTADRWRTRSLRAADGAVMSNRASDAWVTPYFPSWTMSADSRRIVAAEGAVRLRDSANGELQVSLLPLRNEQAVVVSPDGHWRGGMQAAEKEIVYVVQTHEGQDVLTPKEFAERYEWKNDPERAKLGE